MKQVITEAQLNGRFARIMSGNAGGDNIDVVLSEALGTAARKILSEVDWKTYMSAARKSGGERSDRFEKAAVDAFPRKHGRDGQSHQWFGPETSYRGKDPGTFGSDSDFEQQAPTEQGWWNGEKADGIRRYNYGNGVPGKKSGHVIDKRYEYAFGGPDAWDGDSRQHWRTDVNADGPRFNPELSTNDGPSVNAGNSDYYDALDGMASDMHGFYSGKTHYVPGKGWVDEK